MEYYLVLLTRKSENRFKNVGLERPCKQAVSYLLLGFSIEIKTAGELAGAPSHF